MNLLLDTHVVLWWLADSRELSPKVRALIGSQDNAVFVSAATVWEIAIKRSIGKLRAPRDITRALVESDLQALPITHVHAEAAGELARIHDDPFDRMLVAQAFAEKLSIITRDATIPRYGVQVVEA